MTWYRSEKKFVFKVWTFWEGHEISKNLPLKIWRYSVASNSIWKIFWNFVPFSESPNFISMYINENDKNEKTFSMEGCMITRSFT